MPEGEETPMTIPYRVRSVLKQIGVGLLVLAVVALAVWLCWLTWLSRYVLYTRDRGAVLDFSQSSRELSGQSVQKPVIDDPVNVYFNEGENAIDTSLELTQIIGYYITAGELENDLPAVQAKLKTLPKDTPVMLDVKSIYGNFFYSSTVSENRNSDLDIEAMDKLIRDLNSGGYYTIARVPGLRDRLYGLEHVNDGLPVAAGYLWMDDYGCYWLNPASDGTISYLAQIANELKALGFDEVVFTDYYFPETNSIVFRGDKTQTLASTAQTLVNTCASDSFAVSFTVSTFFEAPKGRSRVFLQDAQAAGAAAAAAQFGFEDPEARVVFLTEVHDTRFDNYSVLRPISDAE